MDARRIPFSHEDEERIASAGNWGLIIAITSIASAVLSLITQILAAVRTGLSARTIGPLLGSGLFTIALGLVLGTWLLQAGLAFRKVALTDEADQYYLLLGFSKLRNYFMTLGILILVVLGAALLAMCGGATWFSLLRR